MLHKSIRVEGTTSWRTLWTLTLAEPNSGAGKNNSDVMSMLVGKL
jgi:hypothetical protein